VLAALGVADRRVGVDGWAGFAGSGPGSVFAVAPALVLRIELRSFSRVLSVSLIG
jgi:hypothetical protein